MKFKTYNFIISGKLFSDQVYWTGRSWEKSVEEAQRYSERKRAQTVADELKLVMFNMTKGIKVEEKPKYHE